MRMRACLRRRIDLSGGFIDARCLTGDDRRVARWQILDLIAILDRLEDAILRVRRR